MAEVLSPYELFLVPFYLILFCISSVLFGLLISDKTKRLHFVFGLNLKLFGTLIMSLLVVYYYRGDAYYLYQGTKSISEKFFTNFFDTFKILTSSASTIKDTQSYVYFDYVYSIILRESSLLMVKFGGLIGIFSFKSFLVISLFFGILSFNGSWKIYQTFSHYYPNLKAQIAFATLFIPTNLIYSTGLFKESLAIFLIGNIFYNSVFIFNGYKRNIVRILWLVNLSYLLYLLKPYLIVVYYISFILFALSTSIKKIKSKQIKTVSLPISGLIAAILIIIFYQVITKQNPAYSLEGFAQRATLFSENYKYLDESNSKTFDIGKLDGTFSSLVKKSPLAIASTLYRPFPWESHNLLSLLLSAENIFFVILTLGLLVSLNPFKIILIIIKDPLLILCMSQTLILAFIIGITTTNFGTLTRYRLPLLPFFIFAIFIVLAKTKSVRKHE